MELQSLLTLCMQQHASDLHLTEHEPPILRVDGKLQRTKFPSLQRSELEHMIFSVVDPHQRSLIERDRDYDFSLAMEGMDRFRVNIHYQRGTLEAAFRRISPEIPDPISLGLPPFINELARKTQGLVLVTGAAGMGKSTTLAAMIEMINKERECLIICIEDPVEYWHTNNRSIIKQREVSQDTNSFPEALRHALRQDPDVIVIGEMRDLETIATALTAAETGHLVLATLHTPSAAQSIERIIDVFPPSQQNEITLHLASCLQAIITQLLLPRAAGDGQILATEVLMATPAVRNLIREHQIPQMETVLQTGAKMGMQTMDKSLKELWKKQLITEEVALANARHPEDLRRI